MQQTGLSYKIIGSRRRFETEDAIPMAEFLQQYQHA
jgi:hypothetical protein